MHGSKRVLVRDLNPHILCALCGGYLIQATTVIECLHSFCRSCIVNFLETSKVCPICDAQIHKTRPLLNIRPDQTLQSLVYKLVPGLFQDEMRRRREFHESLSDSDLEDLTLEERGEAKLENEFKQGDDHVSLVLQMVFRKDGRKSFKVKDTRYLLCPSEVTIKHLKRFIRGKFDLGENFKIEMYQAGEELTDDLMLQDISLIYQWRGDKPMCICYTVCEEPLKQKKSQLCFKQPVCTLSSGPKISDIPVQDNLKSPTVKDKHKPVLSGHNFLSPEQTSPEVDHLVTTTPAVSQVVHTCRDSGSQYHTCSESGSQRSTCLSYSVNATPIASHSILTAPATDHSFTTKPAKDHSVVGTPVTIHLVNTTPTTTHSPTPTPATTNSLTPTPAITHLVTPSTATTNIVTITPSNVKSHTAASSTLSDLSSEDCKKTSATMSLKKSYAVVNKMITDKKPPAKPQSLSAHVQDMATIALLASVSSEQTPAATGDRVADSEVGQSTTKVTHLLHSVHSILNKGRKKSQEKNEKSVPLSWKPLQDPNTLTTSPDKSVSLNGENNKLIKDKDSKSHRALSQVASHPGKSQVITCNISQSAEPEKRGSLNTTKEITKSSRSEGQDKCWSLDKLHSKTRSKSSRKSKHSDTPSSMSTLGSPVKADTTGCPAESDNSCDHSRQSKSSSQYSQLAGRKSNLSDLLTTKRPCHEGTTSSCIGSEKMSQTVTSEKPTSQMSSRKSPSVPVNKANTSVDDDIIFTSYIPEYQRHSKLPWVKRSMSCEGQSQFPEPDLIPNKSLGVTLEKRNWKKRKLSTMDIDWPGSAGLPVADGNSIDMEESSKSKVTHFESVSKYNDPYHFHVTGDACNTTELSPGKRLMSVDHMGSPPSTRQTFLLSPFLNSSFGHVVFSPPQKDLTSRSPRYEVGTRDPDDHSATLMANGDSEVRDKPGHEMAVKTSAAHHQFRGAYTAGGESRSPSNASPNKTHHKLYKKGRGLAEDKIGKTRHTSASAARSLEEICVDISSSPSDVSSVTSPTTDVTSPGTEDRTDTSALPDLATSCDAGCVPGYQGRAVPLDLSSKRKI
ncbi:hypothetical protein Btru_001132 [Bulinus truncatus]|nr:hypothetical protein Btru_001132 [Bulinus truncatus]